MAQPSVFTNVTIVDERDSLQVHLPNYPGVNNIKIGHKQPQINVEYSKGGQSTQRKKDTLPVMAVISQEDDTTKQ